MRHFGSRLKEERQRLKLSQTALATVGGVRKQAQLLYEKGERKPDSAYLVGIAKSGVDVLYLITGRRSPALLSADEEWLLGQYRSLDATGRAALYGLFGGLHQKSDPKTLMNFNGPVGQQVQGDVIHHAPLTVNVNASAARTKKQD
jgi:transcriptional regulator with XRE-family HTH domain